MKMTNILNYYKEKLSTARTQARKAKRISGIIGISRLILFLIFCILIYRFTIDLPIFYIIFPIIPFIIIHLYDIKHQTRREKNDILIKILEAEIASFDGDLSSFRDGKEYLDADHEYSFDLELFGANSLFQFLNRTATKEGEMALAELLKSTDREEQEILDIQEANQELAPEIDWRQEILIHGWDKAIGLTPIIKYSKQYQTIITNNSEKIISVIAIITNISTITLSCLGIIQPLWPIISIMALLLLAGLLSSRIKKREIFINQTYKSIMGVHKILMLIDEKAPSFKSKKLKSITAPLYKEENNFKSQTKELSKILAAMDQRNNAIVLFILNGVYFRDFWIALRTDNWFTKNRDNIETWIDKLAELDAIASLSHLTFQYPNSIFPTINQETSNYKATDLKHPLIFGRPAVGNDITIQNDKEFHIVTGANMAGKSTYLRTVGVNLILASAGATVSAKSFDFRPMALFSSMRNADQLSKGISFFHAELLRLKKMKDHLQKHKHSFVLLDEILKGTNSEDKLKGSKIVLKKLIEYPTSGIVATHDLGLKTLEEEHLKHFYNFCFEFEYHEDKIVFDYRLNKGATQKMNASYLLKKIFLEE